MNENEFWAWFAGFWEGEGSFALVNQRQCMSLRVFQSTPKPLNAIRTMCGGNVILSKTPEGKPFYTWQLYKTERIRYVLSKARPFMVFRGEMVDRILNEAAHLSGKGTAAFSAKQSIVQKRLAETKDWKAIVKKRLATQNRI